LREGTQVFTLKLMVRARTRHGTESMRGTGRQPDDFIRHVEERRDFVAREDNCGTSLFQVA
jgi:hypothetical protein